MPIVILEHSLLLLFRHLRFYFMNVTTDGRPSSAGFDVHVPPSRSRGFLPAAGDVEILRTDAKLVLQPILQKLGEIELVHYAIPYHECSPWCQADFVHHPVFFFF